MKPESALLSGSLIRCICTGRGSATMTRRDWQSTVGMAVFALVATVCGAAIFAGGGEQGAIIAMAIVVLALGQVAIIATVRARESMLEERVDILDQEMKANAGIDRQDTGKRLQAVERRLDAIPLDRSEELLGELRAMRQSIRGLAGRDPEPAPRIAPRFSAEPAMPERAAPAVYPAEPKLQPISSFSSEFKPIAVEPPPSKPAPSLDLWLEPIVELARDATAHYRAQASFSTADGGQSDHQQLTARLERDGARPPFDLAILKLGLPVLRRLRHKHPGLRLFVPIGAATIVSESDLDRLTATLANSADVAQAVVFEFPHSVLAGLSSTGIQGLARLARQGSTMALSNVSLLGLDLPALKQLGFRFLTIDANSIEQGAGVLPSWLDFARNAVAMGFEISVSGIASPRQAEAAGLLARFGRGSHFAPPRRVRSDAADDLPMRARAA